eukprot:988295_1
MLSYILAICTLQLISIHAAPISGKATYYGGNENGNACGFKEVAKSSFPYGYYAACGGTIFNSGYGCGECYEIKCIGPYDSSNTGCSCDSTTPTVIISCMDQCPECSSTHFDLDPTSMQRIVGDGLAGTCGIINTEIRRVACNYNGNIKIRSKSGTSSHWYGLHIDDVAGYGSISNVEIKSSGSNTYSTTCDKSQGPSFWICNGGYPLTTPLSVKLTDSTGTQLECNGCITNFNGEAEFDFGANFGVAQVPTSSTTAPAPTVSTTSTSTSTTTSTTTTSTSGGGSNGYIIVNNHHSTQDYYLSFVLKNVDASHCGENIADVQILYDDLNHWKSYAQYYHETSESNDNYNGEDMHLNMQLRI